MSGDMVLIRKLISGEWDDDFLVLEPGQELGMSFDNNVIECVLR